MPGGTAEEGHSQEEERRPALSNSGGCFLPTRFAERCCKSDTSEHQQLPRPRGAETTEQLTFGDGCETLIKSRVFSIIWEGELQKNV